MTPRKPVTLHAVYARAATGAQMGCAVPVAMFGLLALQIDSRSELLMLAFGACLVMLIWRQLSETVRGLFACPECWHRQDYMRRIRKPRHCSACGYDLGQPMTAEDHPEARTRPRHVI